MIIRPDTRHNTRREALEAWPPLIMCLTSHKPTSGLSIEELELHQSRQCRIATLPSEKNLTSAVPTKQVPEHMNALVIADMHVGSAYGIFPPGFTLSTGHGAKLNVGQRYLLKCWQHKIKHLPNKLDYLLLMGDLINGSEHKDGGRGLTEIDPEWQTRAAQQLLEPITKRAALIYYLKGSTYHAGVSGTDEERLARTLTTTPDQWGHHSHNWLILNIQGIYLDLAHHQSVVTRYLNMPLEREIQFAQMSAADDQRPPVDLIIRAHAHRYLWLNLDGTLALSCPAWKLQDTFVQRSKLPNRRRSNIIGSTLLNLQPNKRKPATINRADYIQHTLLWYRHPAKKAVKP